MRTDSPVEFFSDPFGRIHVCQDGKVDAFTLSRFVELTDELHAEIEDSYPKCNARLNEIFSDLEVNKPKQRFRKVERFVRCNFCTFDQNPDITEQGKLHLERPQCAKRGDCPDEGIICMPKYSTELTASEFKVLKLYFVRIEIPEIATRLDIHPSTVEKHLKNAMIRTKTHSRDELVRWAVEKQIIQL